MISLNAWFSRKKRIDTINCVQIPFKLQMVLYASLLKQKCHQEMWLMAKQTRMAQHKMLDV
jgi:hypothetical protein